MRVTTAFKRLLGLKGISVLEVSFGETSSVTLDVALRRRRLVCPLCSFSTAARYDTRPVTSSWRHLDFGRWQVLVRARLRRLSCPEHGVRVEAVPFARARSGFTRDFEDLVAFLATKTTRPPSPACRGWTGTASGGSARGWSPTGWTPTGWTGWSASGWTRSAGGAPQLLDPGRRPHEQEDRLGSPGQGHCHPGRLLR